MLDYNSLLIALSFCSIGLAFTFFVSWSVSRADQVLLTWGIGVSFLVVSLFIYRDFVDHFSPVVGTLAFTAMLIGLTFFMGAGQQFNGGPLPVVNMLISAALSIAAMAIPMLSGYDGVSYIMLNFGAAAIMFAAGAAYWKWRAEAPMLIFLLIGLYCLTAMSFLLCAGVLIANASWIMNHAPGGWAENINLGMCLTSIGGMGALSLGLNQVRLTKHHKREAETDSLTGLFNRRALFDRTQSLPASVAVIVFDIDHFKLINDVHGHQVGDTVLQTFSSLLAANIRIDDMAARIGGEEFAIILPNTMADVAIQVAERVRLSFAGQSFISPMGDFTSTVSGGISYVEDKQPDVAGLLRQADFALYDAKHKGRNRVILYSDRAVAAEDTPELDRNHHRPSAKIKLRY